MEANSAGATQFSNEMAYKLLCKHPAGGDMLQFNALNEHELNENMNDLALEPHLKTQLITLWHEKLWKEEELDQRLGRDVPEFNEFKGKWEASILQKLSLTALGIAIGHANIMRIAPHFDAKLDVWMG
jgi:hypothetical protein